MAATMTSPALAPRAVKKVKAKTRQSVLIITSPFISSVRLKRTGSRMRGQEMCAPMPRRITAANTSASVTADHSAMSAASPTPSDVMPSRSTKKADSAMLVMLRKSCTTKASLARDWPMNQPITQ